MTKFFHNIIERIRSRRQGRTGTTYDLRFDAARLTVRWLTMENETGVLSRSVGVFDALREQYKDAPEALREAEDNLVLSRNNRNALLAGAALIASGRRRRAQSQLISNKPQ